MNDYRQWAPEIEKALDWCGGFLRRQGIYAWQDLPYRTQLVPMAAIKAVLGERTAEPGVEELLARWFWCGVFGELYGGSIESRFPKDLEQVVAWIDGGPEPETVSAAVIVALPTVFSVALNVPTPLVSVLLLGNMAEPAVLVKCTVPV